MKANTQVPAKVIPLSPSASFENPLVNPNFQRRKHRFIYGMGLSPDYSAKGQVCISVSGQNDLHA